MTGTLIVIGLVLAGVALIAAVGVVIGAELRPFSRLWWWLR